MTLRRAPAPTFKPRSGQRQAGWGRGPQMTNDEKRSRRGSKGFQGRQRPTKGFEAESEGMQWGLCGTLWELMGVNGSLSFWPDGGMTARGIGPNPGKSRYIQAIPGEGAPD